MTTNQSPEFIAKCNEYDTYIKNHIFNVKYMGIYIIPFIKDALNLDRSDINVLNAKLKVHDESKFSNKEFYAYRAKFYPTSEDKNADEDKSYYQYRVNKDFDYAWLHHYHYNDHHPEHWCYIDDNCSVTFLNMPDICIAEMIIDWTAMSYAKFKDKYKNVDDVVPIVIKDTLKYWEEHSDEKPLSSKTRQKVELIMSKFTEFINN